jgi:hypothetical protein
VKAFDVFTCRSEETNPVAQRSRARRAFLVAGILCLAWGSSTSPAISAAPSQASWHRLKPGDSVQDSINACIRGGGGVVYFSAGVYTLPTTGNATLDIRPNHDKASGRTPAITLLGDGVDVSIIRTTRPDTLLAIRGDNVTIEGLTFEGAGASGAAFPGIVIGDNSDNALPSYQQHVLSHLTVRNCMVRSTGGSALQFLPYPDLSIECTLDDVRFRSNSSDTLVKVGYGNTTIRFQNCEFTRFPVTAVAVTGADGIQFTQCVFEGENGDNGSFFYANRSVNCGIERGWFEDDPGAGGVGLAAGQWFVQLDGLCHAFTISACTFRRAGGDTASRNPRAIRIASPPGSEPPSVLILNPEIVVNTDTIGNVLDHIQVVGDRSGVVLLGGTTRATGNRGHMPVKLTGR